MTACADAIAKPPRTLRTGFDAASRELILATLDGLFRMRYDPVVAEIAEGRPFLISSCK